jgi:hypothetical protein
MTLALIFLNVVSRLVLKGCALWGLAYADENVSALLEALAHEGLNGLGGLRVHDIDVERRGSRGQNAGVFRVWMRLFPKLYLFRIGIAFFLPLLERWALAFDGDWRVAIRQELEPQRGVRGHSHSVSSGLRTQTGVVGLPKCSMTSERNFAVW